jgi:hypothetical protein
MGIQEQELRRAPTLVDLQNEYERDKGSKRKRIELEDYEVRVFTIFNLM